MFLLPALLVTCGSTVRVVALFRLAMFTSYLPSSGSWRTTLSSSYRMFLPHCGQRLPVVDDGETNATGRSWNPQAKQRRVRTVTFVRTLTGIRIVRRRVTVGPASVPAATGRCRPRSSTKNWSGRPGAPSMPLELRLRWSCVT